MQTSKKANNNAMFKTTNNDNQQKITQMKHGQNKQSKLNQGMVLPWNGQSRNQNVQATDGKGKRRVTFNLSYPKLTTINELTNITVHAVQ